MLRLITEQTAKPESVYQRVIKAGRIRVSYANYPPYCIKDPNSGKLSGIFVDILDEVGKRLGLKIDWVEEVAWNVTGMRRVLSQMNAASPGRVHVNGVDNKPWLELDTFSPEALVAEQAIVALHCWPFWTGAGKFGGPLA